METIHRVFFWKRGQATSHSWCRIILCTETPISHIWICTIVNFSLPGPRHLIGFNFNFRLALGKRKVPLSLLGNLKAPSFSSCFSSSMEGRGNYPPNHSSISLLPSYPSWATVLPEASALPEHLLSAPPPRAQRHVSSMWQEHLIHCNIEFHHVAFSYVTRNIWPDVRGGLGLLRYFPGQPALFLLKESDPATGKSENFQLSLSPVKLSVLHVLNVRCPLSTCLLLFSSIGMNSALIPTKSHIRYCGH